jgi:hypothetical protein
MLRPDETTELSLEEGARRTNRRLASLLEIVDQLRTLRDGPAYRTSDQDRAALDEAIWRFERLVYETIDLDPIARRMARWRELAMDERTQVVADLRSLGPCSSRFRVEEPVSEDTAGAELANPDERARAIARVR